METSDIVLITLSVAIYVCVLATLVLTVVRSPKLPFMIVGAMTWVGITVLMKSHQRYLGDVPSTLDLLRDSGMLLLVLVLSQAYIRIERTVAKQRATLANIDTEVKLAAEAAVEAAIRPVSCSPQQAEIMESSSTSKDDS